MPKQAVPRRQLRLEEQSEAQLALPLPEEARQSTEAVPRWRFCRHCGRPIHEDAPGCGWCRRPRRSPERTRATTADLWASEPP